MQATDTPNGNGHVTPPSAMGLPPFIAPAPIDSKLLNPHGVMQHPLKWPGHDGLPFKGNAPDIKRDDKRQPEVGKQVFVERLDLSDEKQMQRYTQICQVIGNGFAVLSYEERHWVEAKLNWIVLIRWCLEYAYMPR